MQVAAAVELTTQALAAAEAALVAAVVAQEPTQIPTVIIDSIQPQTLTTVNQELVVVVAVVAITEAFHTAPVAKVVLEL